MLCPMKFSAGCSAESKECDGESCMWYVRVTKTSYDAHVKGHDDVIWGCAVAFGAMSPANNLSYSIASCDGLR